MEITLVSVALVAAAALAAGFLCATLANILGLLPGPDDDDDMF
jgi:hypothetical protein